MSLSVLHQLREAELAMALGLLPPNSALLEIGAGTGRQAQMLADRGFAVTAIDIADSNYSANRVWPVVDYDGSHIPAEDGAFDVIFSSNTLEHIAEIDEFLVESQRVLRAGGLCVHILPTSTWRLSSALGHYLRFDRVAEELSVLLNRRKRQVTSMVTGGYRRARSHRNFWRWALNRALPPCHGARGNIFTEHYLFSEGSWRKVFARAGFEVLTVETNRLYYTGHYFVGDRISLSTRKALSRVLGSACKIYVLRKAF